MFNDRIMIECYLKNENVSPKALNDVIYILSKYYIKEKNMDCIETKNEIIKWLDKYNLFFTGNLNKIVVEASRDKKAFTEKTPIWINSEDVKIIKNTVYTQSSRKVALFLLCYAKAYADKDRIFSIRISTMAEWIKINKSNLYGRYLKDLIDFGYITPVEDKDVRILKYFKNQSEQDYQFKFLHPIINCGGMEFKNYDIHAFSKILFS